MKRTARRASLAGCRSPGPKTRLVQPLGLLTALLVTAVGGSGTVATAQDPARPADDRLPVLLERTYSEGRSLTLFAACDANSDDRLDLFEARAAFVDMVDLSASGFRTLDTDADGYVSWPEFDARFQLAIKRSGSVRIRPARSVPDFIDPTVPSDEDPTLTVIRQIDDDGDDAISKEQLAKLLADSGQDPTLAENFPALDADGSGRLEATEFAPLLQFLPGAWGNDAAGNARRRSLPRDFRGGDVNGDGVIDAREFESGLRLLHPSLARWSKLVLRGVDRTGDLRLGGAELESALSEARRAYDLDGD